MTEQEQGVDDSPCVRVECAQARTDLKESAGRYCWLVKNSVDVIAEIDVDGIIRFASPAVERVLGYRPGEVLGTSCFSLIHPDDLPQARQAFAYVLQNPGVSGPRLELRGRHKDGAWRYVEALGKNVTSESNRSAVVFCLRDVTARKQVEAALTRRTRQLETLRTISSEIVRDLNLGQVLQLISQRLGELLGRGHGEVCLWHEGVQALVPHTHYQLDHPHPPVWLRLGDGVAGRVAQTRQGLVVNDYQNWPGVSSEVCVGTRITAIMAEPLLCRDRLVGVIHIHTEEAGAGFTPEDQALLRLVADQAAIAIENARLFRAERDRRAQLEALRATTADIARELDLPRLLALLIQRAVALLEGVSGVVYLYDPETGVLVPKAWVGHGDWLGEIQLRVGEGLAGSVIQQGQGILENAYRTSPYAVPVFLVRTSHTAVLGEPLRYHDRIIGAVLVDRRDAVFTEQERDLLRLVADQAAIALENARLFQEQQRSIAELHRAHEELVRTEKLRALGQMAAGVAHDLNNMLAAILGQAELLRLQVKLPEVREALTVLFTAASDGAQVVRRLLEFGRQAPSLVLIPCDLASLVDEALELTRPRWQDEAQEQGRLIEVRRAVDSLPRVYGNPAEIREALSNLVLNAVDAMPTGGRLTVAGFVEPVTTAPETPDWVVLTVTDTGVGMTDETRRRIFDPFFTTKGVQGTGLGLAVVYGIMERHGGNVAAASSPGQGTTFTLRFRRAEPGNEAAKATGQPSAPGQRCILLIDDEEPVRLTIANLLRAVGHTVIEADSGEQGLACLAGNPVDVVITDLGMPRMTGWEVAQRVKTTHPQLPVFLLTGWGQQISDLAPGQACVDQVLAKPIRLETLQVAIAKYTSGRG